AARPVSVGGGPTKPGIFDQISGKLEKGSRTPEEEKVISDSKAWAESIAGERGRNPQWAATAVTDSASVSADEAKSLGIIDLVADDEQGLLSKIHGMRVRLADGERTIDTSGIKILEVEKDFRTRVLSAVAHPNIAYVLLILGFYGLLFEFTNPGIGFPGIAGSVCLVLAFFGLQVLPTNYAGIALLALAVAMFIAEVKVVSYGLLTIGGLISFFFGSTILFTSPDDFMKVSMPIILSFTVATLLLAGFLTALVLRARGRRPVTGSEGMMGLVGEVTSWNAGSGKVLVRGEIWNARSADTLKRGDEIEVVIAEGMNLLVELKKDS
ncbi:MAG TPA: NfeD family protein, partial [bacterium]|nr:NfeD family protein [bacterium]